MHLFLSGIECVAGSTRLVIEKASVEQVVEYSVAPLPLTCPWVTGLATHGKELIVSVRFDAHIPEGDAPRRAKAVLITKRGAGLTRWGLEVDDVTTFVDVTVRRETAPLPTCPWLVPGTTTDGVEIVWLDVERMIRELEHAPVAR